MIQFVARTTILIYTFYIKRKEGREDLIFMDKENSKTSDGVNQEITEQKPKKPFYKRVWFWILVATVFICLGKYTIPVSIAFIVSLVGLYIFKVVKSPKADKTDIKFWDFKSGIPIGNIILPSWVIIAGVTLTLSSAYGGMVIESSHSEVAVSSASKEKSPKEARQSNDSNATKRPISTPTEKPKPTVTPIPTEAPKPTEMPEPTKEVEKEDEKLKSFHDALREDIAMAQGWATGTVDRNGEPTENGEILLEWLPSIFIESIEWVADRDYAKVYVVPEFDALIDDDKKAVADYAQGAISVSILNYKKLIPDNSDEDGLTTRDMQRGFFLEIYSGANIVGRSKMLDLREYKWH